MRAIAVVSGGLDSVTMAYQLRAEGFDLDLVAFDYGQRHRKELQFSKAAACALDARFDLIDMTRVGEHLQGSALTSDIPVPDGHYAEESMKVTVVPNRNAIMLAIAYGVAVSRSAGVVASAVHAGDHFIYPDCRPGFVAAFAAMQRLATEGFGEVQLVTPFLNASKADIVATGHRLGVPFDRTWSCYKGGDLHCGTCGTCVERREAFTLAGVPDPTSYITGE